MLRKMSLFALTPTLMVIAIYCSWAVAYTQLGRRPRPSMDDPKYIGGFATDFSTFCVWLIYILAAIWVVAVILRLRSVASPEQEQRSGRFLDFILGAIAVGLPFSLLFLHDAIAWFID